MLDFGFFRQSRIELVQQTEVAECGLACLAMISAYHGKNVTLNTLRRRASPSLRGAPLRGLAAAAEDAGLAARPIKVTLEDLQKIELPAILHWNLNHYVVIERFHNGKALIHNPSGRSNWLTPKEISASFTGVAVELQPIHDFRRPQQVERLRLVDLWSKSRGLKRSIGQLVVLSLLVQLYSLGSPYLLQISIDRVIPANDVDLLIVLCVGFFILLVFYVLSSYLRSQVLLYAGTKLGFGVAENLSRHLFRLPIDYFEKRHVGDILTRFRSVQPIQRALTAGAVSSVIDGAFAAFTLAMMFIYNVQLTLIALTSVALYILLRAGFYRREKEAQLDFLVEQSREQSSMIESLRGMRSIRVSNQEEARMHVWQAKLTEATNADIRLMQTTIWQSSISKFIGGADSIATVYVAVNLLMTPSGFSIGMLFAYLAYKGQFTERCNGLLDQIVAFRMLSLHMERLSDVALTDQDPKFVSSAGRVREQKSMNGEIELKSVSFRYSRDDPLTLNSLSLRINAGEHVGITGPSGSGKSTLVKILLGILRPLEGDLLVDGIPIAEFGYRNYHEHIGAVLSGDALFSGSLAENISMFHENSDQFRIEQAADWAGIHREIMAMPMRYETLVGDMGSCLSGGQIQRVLLARALYGRPRILIMDEATSHLDAANERRVSDTVSSMGITRIVIAHRRETLQLADRHLFMGGGRLHERQGEGVGSGLVLS